jgi:hypothetical protein
VEKIEAYLAGDAELSAASYTIAGPNGGTRSLSRCTHTELLNLLTYWRARLLEEKVAAGQIRQSRGIRFDY